MTNMTNDTAEPITLSTGTTIFVQDGFGDDWFPLYVQSGLHNTTVYVRRAQLKALQARLNEILGDSDD